MDPTNYWGQVDLTQIPSVTAPLQAFQAAQQQSAQRALAGQQIQREMQQQATADAATKAALANPNADNLAALTLARPDIASAVKSAHDIQDEAAQRQSLQHFTGIYNYLDPKTPQPDKALSLIQQYQDAATAAGKDTGQFDTMADMVKTNPAQARMLAGMYLSQNVGADKLVSTLGALGKESRDQAEAPGKQDLTAAQAEQARAAAEASRAAATKDRFLTVNSDQGVFDTAAAGAPQTPNAQAPVAADAPRGVRNNNPLNVQPLPDGQWEGQTGTDGRYATFATPEAGMAAADKNLQAYATHHGITTIAGVINRWAPAGENDTGAYVKTVAKDLGIPPNKPINLADPVVRQKLLQSMAKVESPGFTASGSPAPSVANATPGMVYQGPDYGTQALTPEAADYIAQQYISTGQLPPLGNGKAATKNRDAILNRAQAIEAETGATGYDAVARHAAMKSATQSLEQITKMQALVQASEGTVRDNMDLVLKLAPKGGGPTGSPLLNAPIQYLRKSVWGSPQVASFNAAIGTVADEYAKVMTSTSGTGGASSEGARNEAYERLSKASTIGQVQDIMGTLKTEMANRVSNIDRQRQAALDTIKNRGVSAAMPPPGGAAPPPPPPPPPKAGEVRDGFRFKGGNPGDPHNWAKAGG